MTKNSKKEAVQAAGPVAENTPEEVKVSPQQASAILQFLQRTHMQGAEMPAYVDIFNTLSAIVASGPKEGVG